MTEKTARDQGLGPLLADPQAISILVKNSLKQGSSLSFGSSEATVNVSLDRFGDWTIMVGLFSRSDNAASLVFSLEALGFFRATENNGTAYFLWTSALEEPVDARGLVEAKLFETLRAVQRTVRTQYIC